MYTKLIALHLILVFSQIALADDNSFFLCKGTFQNLPCDAKNSIISSPKKTTKTPSDLKSEIVLGVRELIKSVAEVNLAGEVDALERFCLSEEAGVAVCDARATRVRKTVLDAIKQRQRYEISLKKLELERHKLLLKQTPTY